MMYHIYGYYGRNYSGLAESTTAHSIDELTDIVWAYLNHADFVEVVNDRNGKRIRFNPDMLSYETIEYGLDASDFKGLSGPARKTKKSVSPMAEVNKAFAESKKQIKL